MPRTTNPTIDDGWLRDREQPAWDIDAGLTLRPWRDDDADAVLAAYADPAIERWHSRTLLDRDEALALITGWRDGWTAETQAGWAVVDAQRQLAGRVAITGLDLSQGSGGIAYWTTPTARGRGVAPRSVEAVTDWAFRTAGFHRLHLAHSTRNPASCRVAVKSGFVAEGVQRSKALHADGWHDMHLHARIRGE